MEQSGRAKGRQIREMSDSEDENSEDHHKRSARNKQESPSRSISDPSDSPDENADDSRSSNQSASDSETEEDEANLSDESKEEDQPGVYGMPTSDINKPNELEERRVAKRTTDLENLYALLPDVEADVVEIHYDQFDGNADRTYNYLNKKFNGISDNPMMALALAQSPNLGDSNDLPPRSIYYRPAPQPDMDKVQVNTSNLPAEEKKMIKQALQEEKKKNAKKMKSAKKVGFCGCFT
ncbi:unnamed protein product [Moneuplotes crassus]|uniref:Uncharacterized protein n=1 Tax=Euplotes crassus TaxID=5936 RepID=A0AAD1XT84_EUPCR|nr:unnamed protein product [Moneuplotes crassus]